jgi:transcription elongation factor GreB
MPPPFTPSWLRAEGAILRHVSRAFVKEDSSEPPLIVPRAPLPEGAANYVTQRGLALLLAERARLEACRPDPEAMDGSLALTAHNARLSALTARIASAVVLDPTSLPRDEARFSALVTLRNDTGNERSYRIVGVDEADAHAGRIAFTAPLAVRLSGKRIGDALMLRGPEGDVEFEIVGIDYTQETP